LSDTIMCSAHWTTRSVTPKDSIPQHCNEHGHGGRDAPRRSAVRADSLPGWAKSCAGRVSRSEVIFRGPERPAPGQLVCCQCMSRARCVRWGLYANERARRKNGSRTRALSRTWSPSLRAMIRNPSCFNSCSQPSHGVHERRDDVGRGRRRAACRRRPDPRRSRAR
jgi:hypothetical protein